MTNSLKTWWRKQPYKVKWTIFGFIGSLLLWASLSIFFILLTDISHFQTLLEKISTIYEERGQSLYLYLYYLLPTMLFSIGGFALGGIFDEIKVDAKKYTKSSIGGTIGLYVGIVLKILNDYVVKMLTGKSISFLPQEYLSIEFIIFFVIVYATGWVIGKFLENKEIK